MKQYFNLFIILISVSLMSSSSETQLKVSSKKVYKRSEECKMREKVRRSSDKYKAWRKTYRSTKQYKAGQKKYQSSENYKAYCKAYYQMHKNNKNNTLTVTPQMKDLIVSNAAYLTQNQSKIDDNRLQFFLTEKDSLELAHLPKFTDKFQKPYENSFESAFNFDPDFEICS